MECSAKMWVKFFFFTVVIHVLLILAYIAGNLQLPRTMEPALILAHQSTEKEKELHKWMKINNKKWKEGRKSV